MTIRDFARKKPSVNDGISLDDIEVEFNPPEVKVTNINDAYTDYPRVDDTLIVAESCYLKWFMSNKYMTKELFPNRKATYEWDFRQNKTQREPLVKNKH